MQHSRILKKKKRANICLLILHHKTDLKWKLPDVQILLNITVLLKETSTMWLSPFSVHSEVMTAPVATRLHMQARQVDGAYVQGAVMTPDLHAVVSARLSSTSAFPNRWEKDGPEKLSWHFAGLAVLCDAVSRVRSYSEPAVKGIFPLELTWVLTPLPKNLSDQSINQGQACAHIHSIAQTQKILTFMS